MATVNLAHIVAAVEFTVAEMAINPGDSSVLFNDEIEADNDAEPTEAVSQSSE